MWVFLPDAGQDGESHFMKEWDDFDLLTISQD